MLVPIAIAYDENYIIPTCVALTSMFENAKKDTEYKIFVFANSTVESLTMPFFNKLFKKYDKHSFEFIDPQNEFSNGQEMRHLTKPNYYRFLIPTLIPQHDKVLWVDVDTLVLGDLSELYNIDLDDNYIAAVEKASNENWPQPYTPKKDYFNAGVLLFNSKLWRSLDLTSQIKEIIDSGSFKNPTQDPTNILCYKKTVKFSCVYNLCVGAVKPKGIAQEYKGFIPSNKSVVEFIEGSSIVHFTGQRKPWNYKNHPYRYLWDSYFKISVCSSEKIIYDYKDINKIFKILISLIPNKTIRAKLKNKDVKFTSTQDFIKNQFKSKLGYSLDLSNPKTYNEKLQWLKFNVDDSKLDLMTKMTDKLLVRSILEEKGLSQYLNKLIGVYKKTEDININSLPNSFVMKTNHDSGGVWVVKNKVDFDFNKAFKEINKSLKRVYGIDKGEYNYKNIKPCIIIEEFLSDNHSSDLLDYKIHCFNGSPRVIHVDYDRNKNHSRSFYDLEWNNLNFTTLYPQFEGCEVDKPKDLSVMLDIASILSEGFENLRVDLYYINGKIYFGETTFYHGSGFEKFYPEKWDRKLGDMIKLNKGNS